MPPQSAADLAVFAALQLAAPPPPVLPHAATTKTATTARARWRVKLPNFILRSPPNSARAGCATQLNRSNDGDSPPMLEGNSSAVPLISVRPRLMLHGGGLLGGLRSRRGRPRAPRASPPPLSVAPPRGVPRASRGR